MAMGLAAGVLGGLWLLAGAMAGKATTPGLVMGLGLLVIVIVLPLVGAGAYFWVRGSGEAKEYAQLQREQQILNIINSRAKVRISDLALELGMSKSEVRNAIYDLVGKELFTGYADWKEGVLYAKDVAQMQLGQCPNCGAPRTVAGKGVVKCEYCGAELFLPA